MLCGVLFLALLVPAFGECDLQTMGMSELKELVNLLAVQNPFALLSLMHQLRIDPPIKVLDGVEIPLSSYSEPSSQESIFPLHPPVLDGIEGALPSYSEPDSKDSIFPLQPSVLNNFEGALPSYAEPNSKESIFPLHPSKMMHGMDGKLSSYAVPDAPPAIFPLRPPPGATVRVLSGPGGELDLPVAVSPLMRLAEVLRQAGFSFGRGVEDCIRLTRTEHLGSSDAFGWKVTVADRHGQVVYDDLCLPNEKEVIVKPGTVISLSYIPLSS